MMRWLVYYEKGNYVHLCVFVDIRLFYTLS